MTDVSTGNTTTPQVRLVLDEFAYLDPLPERVLLELRATRDRFVWADARRMLHSVGGAGHPSAQGHLGRVATYDTAWRWAAAPARQGTRPVRAGLSLSMDAGLLLRAPHLAGAGRVLSGGAR